MANKKTKKEFYMEMKEIFKELGKGEYVDFCNHQIELLDNKASGSKGLTKVQQDNEIIKNIVLEELTKHQGENGITITELLKQSDVLSNYITVEGKNITNQKLSAMLKKLVDNKQVTKMVDKKKSYFMVAKTPEVEGE